MEHQREVLESLRDESRDRKLEASRVAAKERRSSRPDRGSFLRRYLEEEEDARSRERDWELKERFLESLRDEGSSEDESPVVEDVVSDRLKELLALSQDLMRDL